MNWMIGIRYKARLAVLLSVIVVIILAGSLWERSLLTSMNNSFLSIYKDRLIPAAELFHVNDIMYNKRLLLEKYLAGGDNQDPDLIRTTIALHNSKIDSIITAYETTYLVDEESMALKHFKASVALYNNLESYYLDKDYQSSEAGEYQQSMIPVFQDVNQNIVRLSNIQTTVGEQLLHGSEDALGSANIVNHLQITMVIIVALLVLALLWTSRVMLPKKPQNFHLN